MPSNNTKSSAEPIYPPNSRIRLFRVLFGILILLLLSCAEKPVYRKEVFYPHVKKLAVIVKLLQTENALAIRSTDSFSIKCYSPGDTPSVFYFTAEIEVGFSLGGITVSQNSQGTLQTGLSKVSFIPRSDDQWLYLNGKPYRGVLEIDCISDAKPLLVLNIVPVEDYLKGVVLAEIGKLSQSEMEALKAQAIASRTYALFQVSQNKDRKYDLEATVMDQTYSGVAAEDPQTNRAIQLTRGQVLTYKGKLICSYYSTNCGGKTEYVEKVWDKPPEPYLIPVDDDTFCLWSKNYSWEERWTKDNLEKNIRAFLDSACITPDPKTVNLLDLKIRERSPSGRVEWLDVVTDEDTISLRADKIRWALRKGNGSHSILPSTNFDLEIIRGENNVIKQIIARGKGNGHGVGMCQTGAVGMARAGYSYRDILSHYYTGAKITQCY
jgi:stage II sporulation protein D